MKHYLRIHFIVFGSFMAIRVFHLSLTSAVGIAVFGATAGAIAAYLYLVFKKRKNKAKFNEKIRSVNEPIITNKQIFRKLIIYAFPFIMIDVFKSLYNYIDMVTVVQGLVDYAGFSVVDAESIMSMLSTWGAKFNMIILAISTGIIVSLIPNLTQSVVRKDQDDINHKINQALSILLFFTLPMTFAISFLAKPIWTVFYGVSEYGPSVLSFYIFVGFMIGLFTSTISIVQVLKDYKTVIFSLFIGVVLKFLLNNNLITAFYQMGLPAYYGAITASFIGYFVSFVICIIQLKRKYKINYENFIKNFIDTICGSILMIGVFLLLQFIIPISSSVRLMNVLILVIYVVVGIVVYFIYAHYSKLTEHIFGKNIFKIFRKK